MRKILCLSCFLCSPAMAHFGFDEGDRVFISSFLGLILLISVFFLIFIFRIIYLSHCKNDKEKENTYVFAFYKMNMILPAIVVINVILCRDEIKKIGAITDIAEISSLWKLSLGLIPYYLILLVIYGILFAFNRFRKNNQSPLVDKEDFSQKKP